MPRFTVSDDKAMYYRNLVVNNKRVLTQQQMKILLNAFLKKFIFGIDVPVFVEVIKKFEKSTDKDAKTALEEIYKLAGGLVQYEIGCYYRFDQCNSDLPKAVEWFDLAAKKKYPGAAEQSQKTNQKIQANEKRLEQEAHDAYFWLRFTDSSEEQKLESAQKLFALLKNGNKYAETLLSEVLESVKPGSKLVDVQNQLGCFYARRDNESGVKWLTLAMKNGNEFAAQHLSNMKPVVRTKERLSIITEEKSSSFSQPLTFWDVSNFVPTFDIIHSDEEKVEDLSCPDGWLMSASS